MIFGDVNVTLCHFDPIILSRGALGADSLCFPCRLDLGSGQNPSGQVLGAGLPSHVLAMLGMTSTAEMGVLERLGVSDRVPVLMLS